MLSRAPMITFFVTPISILTIQSHPTKRPAGRNGDESPKLFALINVHYVIDLETLRNRQRNTTPHDSSELAVVGAVGVYASPGFDTSLSFDDYLFRNHLSAAG